MGVGKSKTKWIGLIGLPLVLLCCGWTLWTTTKSAYDGYPASSLRYEWVEQVSGMKTDADLILQGVERKSFTETFAFWTGPWALGLSKFYRPIPSVIWWMEYHTFGENSLACFLAVLALSHVLATLLLWRFLCDLFRSELLGTASTCCFALGLAYSLFRLATPAYALELWVDQVEPWLMLAYVATCWAFLKYLRDGGRWLIASLSLFVVTICVKEAAYSLPLMMLALLWYEKRLRDWKTAVPFFAVAALGLIYRTWALQGLGTKFGSNGTWPSRAIVELGGGSPVAMLNVYEGLPWFIAGLTSAFIMLALRRRRAAVVFGTIAVCGLVLAAWSSAGFDDPFYYQLIGSSVPWRSAVTVTIWLLFTYVLITQPTREQKFGMLWVFITYSVLLASPTTLHTLYLTSVGFGIVIAAELSRFVSNCFAKVKLQPELQSERTTTRFIAG